MQKKSVTDVEVVKLAGCRSGIKVYLLDVVVHAAIDRFNNLIHFLIRPFHDQFHAAVSEVSYISADVVLQGDILDGIPETHPLNPARKVTLAATAWAAGVRVPWVGQVLRRMFRMPIGQHKCNLSKVLLAGQR